MRYRIGIMTTDYPMDIRIIADNIDNMSTVKKIINRGIKQQTSYGEYYFAECLDSDGYWQNITNYWNYLAQEGLEEAYDSGKISLEKLELKLESARYGFYEF